MKKFLLVPFMLAAFAVGTIGSAIANDCGLTKADMTKAERYAARSYKTGKR